MRRLHLLPALLALALSACAPVTTLRAAQTPLLNLSGPAPDVVILAVSGHCPVTSICRAARDNYDYLSHYGTLDALAQPFLAAGLRVEIAGYASGAFEINTDAPLRPGQRGWPALRRDYLALHQVWAAHPPRVIMVGHSHGVAWLHQLARQTPQYPVAVQIDLDAICAAWETNYRAGLSRLPAEVQGEPPITEACTPQRVRDGWARGKDIVWDNVERNLEVQSMRPWNRRTLLSPEPLNPLWEVSPNVRPDGSRRGITTAYDVSEGHSQVDQPDSKAVQWLVTELTPLAQAWAAQAPR